MGSFRYCLRSALYSISPQKSVAKNLQKREADLALLTVSKAIRKYCSLLWSASPLSIPNPRAWHRACTVKVYSSTYGAAPSHSERHAAFHQLRDMGPHSQGFDAKFRELLQHVEHHVEETEMFPLAEGRKTCRTSGMRCRSSKRSF
jgi:hypothetical protein